jgi:hypothetical protein
MATEAKTVTVDRLPFAAHIEHAYTARETATYGGGDHIVVDELVRLGRIVRSPGNALCKARRSFNCLMRGGEDMTPNCKRCIEIANRALGGTGE